MSWMAKLPRLTPSPRLVHPVDWCPRSTFLLCESNTLSVRERPFLENLRLHPAGGKADNYIALKSVWLP